MAHARGAPAALGPVGWARLRTALANASLEPGDLLAMGVPSLQASFDIGKISEAIRRAAPAAMELERLGEFGIWAMSQTDPDYPMRLLDRLGHGAPPIVFGAGERGLLSDGGLAIVGSRDSPDAALAFAASAGTRAGQGRTTVISGAARGIDEAAMRGSLEAAGRVVGVVADHLDRRIRERAARSAIVEGKLTLISPYVPTAAFSVRTAMGRNKLVYGLADAAVIVSSAAGSGGTWEGAIEALKAKHVPVYVWSGGVVTGRQALLSAGATLLPADAEEGPITADGIRAWPQATAANPPQLSLFEAPAPADPRGTGEMADTTTAHLESLDMASAVLERLAGEVPPPTPTLDPAIAYLTILAQRAASLYAAFLHARTSPTEIGPILALRPLVELAILTRWVALDPDFNGYLLMADGEALDLAQLHRLRAQALLHGLRPPTGDASDEALKAAIKEQASSRLSAAGINFGKGRLIPKVEDMVKAVAKADPVQRRPMEQAYDWAYRTFSPWIHSSGSSFRATAARDGDSWRWVGDRSPFQMTDLEAIAASMYAYVLEAVLGQANAEHAAVARAVRDFATRAREARA